MENDFDGYALGGLTAGETQAAMFDTLEVKTPPLPGHRPRHLMGLGKLGAKVGAVLRGVDMFDILLPSRSGPNGQAFSRSGMVNLLNARNVDDSGPLDPQCTCPACRPYCRAYLHHVVKSGEIIAAMLLTWHNLTFYQDLMAELRSAIEGRRRDSWVFSWKSEKEPVGYDA